MEWQKILEAVVMAGVPLDAAFRLTLPELTLTFRGWQRANGINPDIPISHAPMTLSRLRTLAERYDDNDRNAG